MVLREIWAGFRNSGRVWAVLGEFGVFFGNLELVLREIETGFGNLGLIWAVLGDFGGGFGI